MALSASVVEAAEHLYRTSPVLGEVTSKVDSVTTSWPSSQRGTVFSEDMLRVLIADACGSDGEERSVFSGPVSGMSAVWQRLVARHI